MCFWAIEIVDINYKADDAIRLESSGQEIIFSKKKISKDE